MAIVVLLLPATHAQSDSEVDDVEVTAATVMGEGWTSTQGTNSYPDLDLRSAQLHHDSPESIQFRVQMGAESPGGGPMRSELTLTIEIHFRLGPNQYAAILQEGMGARGSWGGDLNRVLGDELYPLTGLAIDVEGSVFLAGFPRDVLRDEEGNIPGKGTALTDFYVFAHADQIRGFDCPPEEPVAVCAFKTRDRLPDAGFLADAVLSSEPGQVFDHLQVTNPNPTRATNGAATTFVYTARILNSADEPDRLEFGVMDAPEAWTIQIPPILEVPAGQSRDVIVAISIPFAHEHGTTEHANLSIESRISESEANLRFSVEWIDPPQPAGHHDTLYLHYDTGKGDSGLNMDTEKRSSSLEGHPNFFVSINTNADGEPTYRAHREAPLWPGLLMGLDGDLMREGDIQVAVTSQLSGDFRLHGAVTYIPNAQADDPSPKALFSFDQVVALEGGDQELLAAVTPLPASDRVDVVAPGELILSINIEKTLTEGDVLLSSPSTATGELQLRPDDSHLTLPLLEYAPRIPDVPLQEQTLPLDLEENTLRRAPGATAVFHMNLPGETQPVTASSEGPYEVVALDGSVVAWTIVPEDARDDDTLDGVVRIEETATGRYAFVSIRTIVDTTSTQDDDTILQGLLGSNEKSTNAVGSVILLAALMAMTVRRRQRQ